MSGWNNWGTWNKAYKRYVDPVAGNDGNDGLTPATAYKTVDQAATVSLARGEAVGLKTDGAWHPWNAGPYTAATYFIDQENGDDAKDGTTPSKAWKTLAKHNSSLFAAGNVIALRRGCSWSEQLTGRSNGAVGNPIIYAAYGTGAAPRILGTGTTSLNTSTKSYLTFRDLDFRLGNVYANGGSDITFIRCRSLMQAVGRNGCQAGNSPNLKLYHCVFTGGQSYGLYISGTTTALVRNCIIGANKNISVFADAGTTIDLDYCVLNGTTLQSQTTGGTGTITLGGHNIYRSPRMTQPILGGGKFCITSDDWLTDYWTALAEALRPYGVKFTAFSTADATPAALAALAAEGHEIACHSYTHTQLDTATAFTVTTTNGSPSITIDAAGKTLTLTCGTPANNVTMDWNATPKTIQDLQNAVGGKGWTVTLGTNVNAKVRLSGLADSGGAKGAFPYAAQVDIIAPDYRFWANEITALRAWITTQTGVQPSTIAYPWGVSSAGLINWLRDVSGLSGGRGTVTGQSSMASVDIYNMKCVGPDASWKGDGSESAIRAAAATAFEWAQQQGTPYIVLTHDTNGMTVQQVVWFVDEILALGGQFVTFGQLVAEIRADHTSADGLAYTKTYYGQPNVEPQSSSPCIDAGEAIAGVNDGYLGAAPDIGCCEVR